jgi:hypothetical protein
VTVFPAQDSTALPTVAGGVDTASHLLMPMCDTWLHLNDGQHLEQVMFAVLSSQIYPSPGCGSSITVAACLHFLQN